MKVWITKYALSKGIIESEARDADGGYVSCPGFYGLFGGSDWVRSKEAAQLTAESMRIHRIASLKKQIAKLEKLKF
jgi:hypothetical protein